MKQQLASLATGILMVCGAAQAYPVGVTLRADGLAIEANEAQLGAATILDLVNSEPFAVRCDVHFRNGPERRRRKVTVAAAARHTVRFSPSRAVVRVRVTVDCWPAHQQDEPGDDPDIERIIKEE